MERQGRQLVESDRCTAVLLDRLKLLVVEAPNVDLAVAAAAHVVDHWGLFGDGTRLRDLIKIWVLAAREPILLHLHAAIVGLHISVLDSEDVELSLRLRLLFAQCLLNTRHFLHCQAHLRGHVLVLSLHLSELLDLPRQDCLRVPQRLVF